MTQRCRLLVFLVIVMLVIPLSAQAAINCTITTVGVAFGTYDVFSAAVVTSAGSVTIRCVGIGRGVEPVTVSLGPGKNGSFHPRKMFRGLETLDYNLYIDAGGTQIWGDSSSGTQQFSSVSNNRPVTLPVFGRVPPGQDVSVGNYSDTIVATINF